VRHAVWPRGPAVHVGGGVVWPYPGLVFRRWGVFAKGLRVGVVGGGRGELGWETGFGMVGDGGEVSAGVAVGPHVTARGT